MSTYKHMMRAKSDAALSKAQDEVCVLIPKPDLYTLKGARDR